MSAPTAERIAQLRLVVGDVNATPGRLTASETQWLAHCAAELLAALDYVAEIAEAMVGVNPQTEGDPVMAAGVLLDHARKLHDYLTTAGTP